MKLGRYELVEPIAKGGMAQIYRARLAGPAGFEQIFAIKRILPQYSGNRDFRRLFINEAKVASLLRHPNIVSVLELGQEDDSLYLVMEYVDGIDLHRLIKALEKQGRRLQPDLVAHVIVGLLKALAYAHSRTDSRGVSLGIVHRDVTPHNTLLTKEGLIKLADFGIAKAAFTTFKTAQGLTRGKLGYMSPEQIRGGKLTGASDLFTVGIMLLELLTGSLRTSGRSPKALVKETLQGTLAKHPGLKDAPVALADLCRRLLATEPVHRPTATEALQALAESGWDKDRAVALAALIAEVSAAAPPAGSRKEAPKPGPGPAPPSPEQGRAMPAGALDTEIGSDRHPAAVALDPEASVHDTAAPDTEGPLNPAAGPTEAMDELPTVILNEPGQGPLQPPPPETEGPSPKADSAAGPRDAMDSLATVILERTAPAVRAPGPPPGAPQKRPRADIVAETRRLDSWRWGLRAAMGLAAILLLVLALVMGHRGTGGKDRHAGTAAQDRDKPYLPKGRILLVPRNMPGSPPPGLRIDLDGQPIPQEAEQIALEPGAHQVTWWIENRRCERRNILVEAGKPIRLERLRPCSGQIRDMGKSKKDRERKEP